MSLTCVFELNEGKYYIGKFNDPIYTFLNASITDGALKNLKIKKIVFIDDCDLALKIGQYSLKYGQNNIICNQNNIVVKEKIPKKGLENNGKKWTPEERVEVLKDYVSKMSIKDISSKYKRTISAIISELISNIPKTTEKYPESVKKLEKWSKEEIENLVNHYTNNTDMLTMVNTLGRSKRAIECRLIHLGLYKF